MRQYGELHWYSIHQNTLGWCLLFICEEKYKIKKVDGWFSMKSLLLNLLSWHSQWFTLLSFLLMYPCEFLMRICIICILIHIWYFDISWVCIALHLLLLWKENTNNYVPYQLAFNKEQLLYWCTDKINLICLRIKVINYW